jgi:hypothetical protein
VALIAIAADKGSPGVTTAAIALATVWPRPVLLAECDPAGGDLAYRLPAERGGRLDNQRGLLSLAIAARHGLSPQQVWDHTQRLPGGLAVLTGVATAEQGAGLDRLWRPVGTALSRLREADVIADCGRIGVDGPPYDLLAEAAFVVLVMRASLGEVVRLRERAAAVAACGKRRGQLGPAVGVIAVAGQRDFSGTIAELSRALNQGQERGAARLLGGLAYEPKSAAALSGERTANLAKSLLIRSAREIAARVIAQLPEPDSAGPGGVGPEPARAEPVRAEPVRPEPVRPGLVRPGPVRPEPVPADPARPEMAELRRSWPPVDGLNGNRAEPQARYAAAGLADQPRGRHHGAGSPADDDGQAEWRLSAQPPPSEPPPERRG